MRRRYKTLLSMVAWKGHANLMLDRTKYVGINAHQGVNMAHIRREMLEREDMGEMIGIYMAHETDVPTMDALSYGWGDALD